LLVLALGACVPLAAIAAGALLAALVLLDPRPLVSLARASRAEAANALVTLLAITLLGLANGVLVGLVLSLLASVSRVARSRARVSEGKGGAPHQLALGGPITFLSAPTLLDLRARLDGLEAGEGLVIDLRSVSFVDATGAARLLELTRSIRGRGGRVALLGVSPQCRVPIERADRDKTLEVRFAVSDRDVDRILVKQEAFSAEKHVLAGLSRFRAEMREHYLPLFDQLADGQSRTSRASSAVRSFASECEARGNTCRREPGSIECSFFTPSPMPSA
jgi:MFS superfamily sulfate permease-like transporter